MVPISAKIPVAALWAAARKHRPGRGFPFRLSLCLDLGRRTAVRTCVSLARGEVGGSR